MTVDFRSLMAHLRSSGGTSADIREVRPFGSSSFHETFRVTLSDGLRLFLKCGPGEALGRFQAEAAGLKRLADGGYPWIPAILGCSAIGPTAFLALSFIQEAPPTAESEQAFGEALARLHGNMGTECGLDFDTWLGPTLMVNQTETSWAEFFRVRRWDPLLKRFNCEIRAQASLRKRLFLIEEIIEDLLAPVERVSLLHGDLWSGNILSDPEGRTWLIDPAPFHGDPEMDMAMTVLFGRRTPAFEGAYRGNLAPFPGWEARRHLYMAWHLLHHVLLFGSSYLASLEEVLSRIPTRI